MTDNIPIQSDQEVIFRGYLDHKWTSNSINTKITVFDIKKGIYETNRVYLAGNPKGLGVKFYFAPPRGGA